MNHRVALLAFSALVACAASSASAFGLFVKLGKGYFRLLYDLAGGDGVFLFVAAALGVADQVAGRKGRILFDVFNGFDDLRRQLNRCRFSFGMNLGNGRFGVFGDFVGGFLSCGVGGFAEGDEAAVAQDGPLFDYLSTQRPWGDGSPYSLRAGRTDRVFVVFTGNTDSSAASHSGPNGC